MQRSTDWVHPRGSLTHGQWQSVVDDSIEGWEHTGIRIGVLTAGTSLTLPAGDVERMIVPLTGDVSIEWMSDAGVTERVDLVGRGSVFDGPADVAYLPVGASATLTGSGHGPGHSSGSESVRVAVAEAPATEKLPFSVIRGSEVVVEIRGAGRSTRQVHNFGTPSGLRAQKLIVCEVITPAENWSSYPAHKHDEDRPGVESKLEEIYYFESAVARGTVAPDSADPFGMFATYSSPAGDIAINALVHTGDIALVPFGYHGPAVAAPGYDLYYLNVMAGPGHERVWNISDDPAHSWVRETWLDQAADPRLPYSSAALTLGASVAASKGPTE